MSGNNRATYPDLAGKTVFLTGGATGIGAAMVRAFCGQAANVSFVDILEEESQKLAAEVSSGGRGRAKFIRCDLRNTGALGAAIDKVGQETGSISVLVNNAGNDDRHDFSKVTEEYWDARISSICAIISSLARRFAADEGAAGGFDHQSELDHLEDQARRCADYSTCKAAIHGMTRALAPKFGAFGVRVNTISPGAVWTERQVRLWYTPEMEAKMNANQCLKVKVLPEDVADLALF